MTDAPTPTTAMTLRVEAWLAGVADGFMHGEDVLPVLSKLRDQDPETLSRLDEVLTLDLTAEESEQMSTILQRMARELREEREGGLT